MTDEDSHKILERVMTFAPLAHPVGLRTLTTLQPGSCTPRLDQSDKKRRAIGVLGWSASFVAVWSILVGGRAQVVSMLPSVAPVYAAIGLKVNLRHMDVFDVTAKLMEEDGRKILLVEGQIRNTGAAARTPPRMRLAIENSHGREIYFWTAAPPKSRLNAGENAFFRARLAAPPEEGTDVRVRFAPDASST